MKEKKVEKLVSEIMSHPAYMGKISFADTIKLLVDKKIGTYLLRKSQSRENGYVIAYKNEAGEVQQTVFDVLCSGLHVPSTYWENLNIFKK